MKVSTIKDILQRVLAFEVKEIKNIKYKMVQALSIGDQYEGALLPVSTLYFPISGLNGRYWFYRR